MAKEIERKFLLPKIPNATISSSVDMIQGYLSYTEQYEIRVRSIIDENGCNNCYLTVKASSKDSRVRDEIEMPITSDLYNQLIISCKDRKIHKSRHKIIMDGYTAELDIYHGKHSGLRIVEVEFNSVEDADNFNPPDWFGEEVTGERGYKNSEISSSVYMCDPTKYNRPQF